MGEQAAVPSERPEPTVFLQTDWRWRDEIYDYNYGDPGESVEKAGCGLLALTNAIYYLNGVFVEPMFIANFAVWNGFHIAEGTTLDMYKAFPGVFGEKYGVRYAGMVEGYEELAANLRQGCVAICSIPGHIMAIVDYDEDSKQFLILDSRPHQKRGTEAGYAWLSQEQLEQLPSLTTNDIGLSTQFTLLAALGTLQIISTADGETSADCGTFDVWIGAEKVADDQSSFTGSFPMGTFYTIDDVQAKDGWSYDLAADIQGGRVDANTVCVPVYFSRDLPA